MSDVIEGFEICEHLDRKGVGSNRFYLKRNNRPYRDFDTRTTQMSKKQAEQTRKMIVDRILAARKSNEQRTHG